jgi:hypothetical protein
MAWRFAVNDSVAATKGVGHNGNRLQDLLDLGTVAMLSCT